MSQASRSQGSNSTESTSTTQSSATLQSSRKRRTTASSTANTPPEHNKRIKTEKAAPTESTATNTLHKGSSSIYDGSIEFIIGEGLTSFGIHQGVLRRSALIFFKDLLSRIEMTEGDKTTHTIILRDENPDTFRRFVTWLYSQTIVLESEAFKDLPWIVIIEVYSFAERNSIRGLQNVCVDTVIEKTRNGGLFPAQGDLNKLWTLTGNVYRLRRLLLDLFAVQCNLSNAIANNGSYHPRFLQGLVQTMFDMKKKRTIYEEVDFWQKRQDYYVDDTDNPIVLD